MYTFTHTTIETIAVRVSERLNQEDFTSTQSRLCLSQTSRSEKPKIDSGIDIRGPTDNLEKGCFCDASRQPQAKPEILCQVKVRRIVEEKIQVFLRKPTNQAWQPSRRPLPSQIDIHSCPVHLSLNMVERGWLSSGFLASKHTHKERLFIWASFSQTNLVLREPIFLYKHLPKVGWISPSNVMMDPVFFAIRPWRFVNWEPGRSPWSR